MVVGLLGIGDVNGLGFVHGTVVIKGLVYHGVGGNV